MVYLQSNRLKKIVGHGKSNTYRGLCDNGIDWDIPHELWENPHLSDVKCLVKMLAVGHRFRDLIYLVKLVQRPKV